MGRIMGPLPRVSDYFPLKFSLVCLDTQQVQYLSPHRDIKYLGGFFSREPPSWVCRAWWLWASLARPVLAVQHVQAYTPSCRSTPAAIERLPNELLDEIFDYLSENKKDMLALGLSSAFLWNLIVRRVQRDYGRSAGVFAGKRMLYLGQGDYRSYLTSFGLSPTEVTQPCHRALLATQHLSEGLVLPWLQSEITKSVGQGWAEALILAKHWDGISPAVWKCIERDLTPAIYPQDRVWVLRNLTTCEFVRSDKLQPVSQQVSTADSDPKPETTSRKLFKAAKVMALLKEGAAAFTFKKTNRQKTSECAPSGGLDSTPITFAQIFLVLICYSREVPYDERCLEFQEGRWAGHAFDIVTWEAHATETTPHEWADVSELAVDDVANLRHWAQQLELALSNQDDPKTIYSPFNVKPPPRDLWQRVSEDRRIWHDWEGLDTQSPSGASRWSQKPVQRGLLVSFPAKGESSSRR